MKIIKKAVGLAAIGTMAASGFAFVAPSSDAVVTSVGSCSGTKGIGSAKSTVIGDGITDSDDQDVSIGIKGVPNPSTSPSSFGTCTFAAGVGTPDNAKPPAALPAGVKNLAKWGAKLFSPESDCNTLDTGDLTEWPLNGKISQAFTQLNGLGGQLKIDGYVAVDGFTDPDNDPNTPSDVVTAHGIVTKGVAAGADIAADLYFDPVLKDKTQTTEVPYPGYNFDLAGALGCTTVTPNDANVLAFMSGDGTSLLLALPAAGVSFTKGS